MKALNALSSLATLFPLTTAHFSLTTQNSLGLTMDTEDKSPCGGSSYSSSSTTTDFHIGGDSVGVKTSHPQANILIRGTLDTTASGNWTNLFPIIGQYGLGDFCEPDVTAPATWVGRTGLIQVIEHSVDGFLFQCAAVKFVEGTASVPGTCINGTGVTGSFTSDGELPAVQQSSASATLISTLAASAAATSSTTSATPAATSSTLSAGDNVKLKEPLMGLVVALAILLHV